MLQRCKRLWHLTLLAKDMVAARLGAKRAKQRVADRIGRMHGLPQKIGQLLALFEMEDPSIWSTTTETRALLPRRQVIDIIEKSLNRRLSECFRFLEPDGIAASIGQVHRGVLHDGRLVAVKVQYPDGAANVETDLKALGWFGAPAKAKGRGFDGTAYKREIGAMMRRELDYTEEALALKQFGRLSTGDEWLVTPDVIDDLSTDRVLTMTWLEGERFDSVRHWPEPERRQAAQLLLRLFLRSYFAWGLLHADPHPGNYRFLRTKGRVQIGLLDFGCVRAIAESQRHAIAGLIDLARRSPGPSDEAEALSLCTAAGFNPDLLAPMARRLPQLNRILFEPFAVENSGPNKGYFDISSWNLSERVGQALDEDRWNFRIAGPAELILVIRSYLGLNRYLRALKAPVDWWGVLQEVRGSLPANEQPRLDDAQPQCDSFDAAGHKGGNVVRSQHLRVRVSEAECTRVDLTFRAAAAEYLADLVPPELEDRLKERGLDVHQIAADAVARDFSPGELFQLTDGAKRVRVWLE